MVLVAALLGSAICGIVTFCIALVIYKRNNAVKTDYSRETIFEATKRRLDVVTAASSSSLNDEHEQPTCSILERFQQMENSRNNSHSSSSGGAPLTRTETRYSADGASSTHSTRISFHTIPLINADTCLRDSKFDVATSLPIVQPLKTVANVYEWLPGFDNLSVASVPLRSVKKEIPQKPRTLVCHDMGGGYTEDRFIQGYKSMNCYRIHHWNFIDIFVYFSHNIVTIPPPCWTNAGHKHGVKVLGTFITEWKEGARYCSSILDNVESYQHFAKQLVDIACYYNFDGWLINIENEIIPSQVESLVDFLRFLTTSMHSAKPDSQVIWYDSVISSGKLKWQNELNAQNRIFFDVCDGIYLNYTWTIENLARSAMLVGNTRKFDVYAGLDCFGRGCFGGGGWNSHKAFQVIRDQSLSAAIFAPGWVLETHGEAHFNKFQNKFWHLLMTFLYPHVVSEFPLVSTFCQGYGKYLFVNGKKVINKPWTNLSCQQLQPTYSEDYYQLGSKKGIEIKSIQYCTLNAYNGGGCRLINGIANTQHKGSRTVIRLFRCSLAMQDPVFVSLCFKLDKPELIDVSLLLLLEEEPNYIILGPSAETPVDGSLSTMKIGGYVLTKSRECKPAGYKVPRGQQQNYRFFDPLSDVSQLTASRQCSADGCIGGSWQSRYYLLSERNLSDVKEIRIVCATKDDAKGATAAFKLMIGELRVIKAWDLAPTFPKCSNIRARDTVVEAKPEGLLLSTTILWEYPLDQDQEECIVPVCCDVYCEGIEIEGHSGGEMGVLLGRAFVDSYRIAHVKVSKTSTEGLDILIQPISDCNIRAPRDQCATFKLTW